MSTIAEPRYRKRVGYQAVLLGGFATMAGILLIVGDSLTRDTIAARQKEDLLARLSQVIPADRYDRDLLAHTLTREDGMRIYRAVRNDTVSGLAFERVGQGYGGAIRVLMGVDDRGRLLGVRVLSHAETPGLGDKIEAERDDWIHSFVGLSLGNPPAERWAVRKDGGDFDQFTGATITPRAVVQAVKEGLVYFDAHQGELIAFDPVVSTTHEDAEP